MRPAHPVGPAEAATPLVLLVEDTPPMARLYLGYLRDLPVTLAHVETGRAALSAIRQHRPAAALVDARLPDMDGLSLLRRLHDEGAGAVPVLIGSGTAAGAEGQIEALRLGAFDVLAKPVAADRLRYVVAAAIESRRAAIRLEAAGESAPAGAATAGSPPESPAPRDEPPAGLVGRSPPMRRLFARLAAVAACSVPLLLAGEPGVGKAASAALVHRLGPRAGGPFRCIECAGLPGAAMEAELFGSAAAARPGALAEAEGGTLVLDEPAGLDAAMQARLWRFLQAGAYRRAGAATERRADVRLVVTSARDLRRLVADGLFREDLYPRLSRHVVVVPPLRERGEDVLVLARHLQQRFATAEGYDAGGFTPEAEALLCAFPWPGNVAALGLLLRQLVVLYEGQTVTAAALEPLLAAELARAAAEAAPPAAAVIRPLDAVVRAAMARAVALCRGDVAKAAALLGVSPAALYRRGGLTGAVAAEID